MTLWVGQIDNEPPLIWLMICVATSGMKHNKKCVQHNVYAQIHLPAGFLDAEEYSYFRNRGMSSQLVRPNLTLQLNAWVADNFMNIEIPFSTLYYNVITLKH